MAMELFPAESIPRISFSHDFCSSMQQYCPPLRSTNSLPLNSSIDFEFDVRINNVDQDSYYSSADELFSNGKILPLQIKQKISPPPPKSPITQARNGSSKDQNQSSKPFWQFKRSSSLSFVSGSYKGRLCPSSSRSSSTGSAPKVKPGPVLKDGHGVGNNQRQKYLKKKNKSSTSNQKPPLEKSFTHRSHSNGVTINPTILSVPLVDFFCLSSIFLTGKDKKN